MMALVVLLRLSLVSVSFALRPSGLWRSSRAATRLFTSDSGEGYIFYPSGPNSDLSDEEALQDLFIKQLSEMHSKEEGGDDYVNVDKDEVGEYVDGMFPKLGALIGTKTLHEEPIELTPGCPVEIAHKGRIAFGNFVRVNAQESSKTRKKRKEAKAKGKLEVFEAIERQKVRKSLLVQLSTGENVMVDVGQIISSWEVLADEEIPDTPAAWAEVASDALRILSNMSPRKSDLQEFWSILSTRSSVIPADSLDLGVYIYQEKQFGNWINPYLSAEESHVRALSAAQRYAAALLLHYDDFHFKRRPSKAYLHKEEDDEEGGVQQGDEESYLVVEGGYRCLDEGMTLFREGEVFQKYYDASRALEQAEAASHEKPFRAGCITRQLRALEMYSMASGKMAPPTTVKHILKKLHKPQSPVGAREVINDMRKTGTSSGGSSSSGSGERQMSSPSYSSITPWTSETIEDTEQLISMVASKRGILRQTEVGKTGKKGPNGRMDYRGVADTHPPICMDGSKATFFDDAFSLNPATGELLVHIVDVAGTIRKFPALENTAKERLNSIFLPSGPVHMMPPQALEALKLSTTDANEVLTCAISVDVDTGDLLGYRIFASVIGPVNPIEMSEADEILEKNSGGDSYSPVGYNPAVVRDLVAAHSLVQKVIARNPWVDAAFDKAKYRRFSMNKKSGEYTQNEVEKTSGTRTLNAMLTLYSNASCSFCENRDVSVPIAWENRDRVQSNLIRRFATQPLRNWLAQLQQKQLRAALKLEVASPRKDCALAVAHVNKNKKQQAPLLNAGRTEMVYEALEAHCATVLSNQKKNEKEGEEGVWLHGTVFGSNLIKLRDFQVIGQLQGGTEVEKGQALLVKVLKVDSESKTCHVSL